MNNKVLIINPPAHNGVEFIREGRCEQRLASFQYCMVPISLPSIAGLLEAKDIPVKITDCIADGIDIEGLLKIVKEYKPRLCLLNIATASYNGDIQVAGRIKEVTDAHLTAIGNHVTSLPQEALKESRLDSVVIGEPEATVLELAQQLGDGAALNGLRGLHYKAGDKIVANERRPFIENLDELPFPARNLLDNRKYFLPVINEPYTLLISSRGCPHKCVYCTAHQYYGKKLRTRSPENILDEIEEIVNKDGIRNITMWSDTFTLSKGFVMKICQGILDRKIDLRWMANSRVDSVDPEMLRMMAKAHCIGLSFGIESGVQRILDNSKKGATIEQTRNAVKWAKEAGIESLAHVIFGLPGETPETIRETIRFIKEIDPDYAQFYSAIPFPGTEFTKMAKENGWITSGDWNKYELNQVLINTPQLSAQQLKQAKVGAYRQFYLRPHYFMKRIRKIKSFKDLMVNVRQGLSFVRDWVLKS